MPLASLAVTSAALVAGAALAGCGGDSGPALGRAEAQQLIALARHVGRVHGGCAQQRAIVRVQAEARRLVAAHEVPPELEQTLLRGVAALVDDQPTCLPAVAATTTTPPPPPPPRPAPVSPRGRKGRHGHLPHEHGHGHHHGHGRDT